MTDTPDSPTPAPALIVLYDADCGFCMATVRWLQRRDRGGGLTFVALQDAAARADPWRATVAGHDLRAALHVVDTASDAVAEGGRAMLAVLRVLPRWRVRGPAGECPAGRPARRCRLPPRGGSSPRPGPPRRRRGPRLPGASGRPRDGAVRIVVAGGPGLIGGRS